MRCMGYAGTEGADPATMHVLRGSSGCTQATRVRNYASKAPAAADSQGGGYVPISHHSRPYLGPPSSRPVWQPSSSVSDSLPPGIGEFRSNNRPSKPL